MRMPKLMSGWVTSDRKVHDSREEATNHEVRAALLSALHDKHNELISKSMGYGTRGLTAAEAAEVVLRDFHIEPKVVEPTDSATWTGK
jgi:hypothetical protein